MSEILIKIREFIEDQDKIHTETELKNKPLREKYDKEMVEWESKKKSYDEFEEQTGRDHPDYTFSFIFSSPKIPIELGHISIDYVVSKQLKEIFEEELRNERRNNR